MKPFPTPAIIALLSIATIGAWQGALSTLGLGQKELQSSLLSLDLPPLSNAGRIAAKAMTPEQRAAAVREVASAIKALVKSDSFQKAYAARIKSEFNAVDHGLKEAPAPKNVSDMERQAAAGRRQMAVQMAMMFRSFPFDGLKATFAEKQQNWAETLKDKDASPEDRAMAQKMTAKAKTIAPLMNSNPEQFRKAFSLLMSAEMGGPETEEALVGASASGEREQQLQLEQRAWNDHNLKTALRKKLSDFAALAASVDFAAQTRDVGGRKVFVNPVHERQSGEWKIMYRAGKAPVVAAADFARAWLKEL